jgi:hypothetical protein
MDLHKTINGLKVLVSWVNEERQLVKLNDDEIKTLNNSLKLLTEQAEKVEKLEEELRLYKSHYPRPKTAF